jgi:hypothetical protein
METKFKLNVKPTTDGGLTTDAVYNILKYRLVTASDMMAFDEATYSHSEYTTPFDSLVNKIHELWDATVHINSTPHTNGEVLVNITIYISKANPRAMQAYRLVKVISNFLSRELG